MLVFDGHTTYIRNIHFFVNSWQWLYFATHNLYTSDFRCVVFQAHKYVYVTIDDVVSGFELSGCWLVNQNICQNHHFIPAESLLVMNTGRNMSSLLNFLPQANHPCNLRHKLQCYSRCRQLHNAIRKLKHLLLKIQFEFTKPSTSRAIRATYEM